MSSPKDYSFAIDKDLVDYAQQVARALEGCGSPGLDYYAQIVVIAFEGDPTEVAVVPNEFGGYGVAVKRA